MTNKPTAPKPAAIVAECEVCGSTDAARCSFEVCCSCWRGVPCNDVRPVPNGGVTR